VENTHKILFLNSDTLETEDSIEVSPPFNLEKDAVTYLNGAIRGINKPFIIVEKDYTGAISQEMLCEFQKEIAYKMLEAGYSKQTASLMSNSEDYEEYLLAETELKKKYFQVKKEIPLSTAPFLLNLELV
jgi:hypothetical protein